MTQEEFDKKKTEQAEKRKARKNNGAKRDMHYEMKEVLNEYSGKFNLTIKLDTIADYGGWTQAYKIYFDDGGWFDEIYNN